MEQGIVYLKRKRLVELENQLRELKTVARRDIADKIAEARSHGDLSENAEYDAAKEAQSHLEMKIGKLENLLSRVKIIEDSDIPDDTAYVLTEVKVFDLKRKEELSYHLVSPDEADFEQDKISIVSPLGKALLGKKVGEVASFTAPAGTIEYKILEIKK